MNFVELNSNSRSLCANMFETFTPQLIRVEGGEVLDYGSTYC